MLAPFVAPDEVLSLEIPLEPFDAKYFLAAKMIVFQWIDYCIQHFSCPEVVDFCNEMRADPEFALYLNNFVVDEDMNQEFVKAKEGFLHAANPLQKVIFGYMNMIRHLKLTLNFCRK